MNDNVGPGQAAARVTPVDTVPLEPPDYDAVLAGYFGDLRACIGDCVRVSCDRAHYMDSRQKAMKVAAHLIRTSVHLAGELKGRGREFTHRIIVERANAPGIVDARATPQVSSQPSHRVSAAPVGGTVPTPPPGEISGTIHGGFPRVRTP